MSDDSKGFVLKDSEDVSSKNQAGGAGQGAGAGSTDQSSKSSYALPEINFSTFIFSLNSSVLVLLGAIEDPASGTRTKNLLLAKQTIDIIGMLEEKTQGNLTPDEEKLLKNILHDLRILYVKEKGK